MESRTSNTSEQAQPFLSQASVFKAEDLLAPLLKGLSHVQKLTLEGRDMDLDWVQASLSSSCRYLTVKIASHQLLLQQVDKIHLMFRHLFAETELNSTFRQHLLNLFAPLTKYILLHPEFMEDAEQPMRLNMERLLAAAQRLSPSDCHATQHFNQQFGQMVTNALVQQDIEKTALLTLMEQFVTAITQQQQRTNLVKQRLKQAFTGQFLHKKVSQNSLYCLQKLQNQYVISEDVYQFLQDAVLPALNLRGLNQGCESQEYMFGLKLVHQMIRSVQPHKDLTSRNSWSAQFGAIQQNLKKFLTSTTHDSTQISKFVCVLKQAQLNALQAIAPKPAVKQFIEPLKINVDKEKLVQKIAVIKPGQWLDLQTPEGWVRCQVIVNCCESKAIMLANRVGIKVDLLDYDNVIQRLASKQIRSIKLKPLLQQSLDLIHDEYQQQASA